MRHPSLFVVQGSRRRRSLRSFEVFQARRALRVRLASLIDVQAHGHRFQLRPCATRRSSTCKVQSSRPRVSFTPLRSPRPLGVYECVTLSSSTCKAHLLVRASPLRTLFCCAPQVGPVLGWHSPPLPSLQAALLYCCVAGKGRSLSSFVLVVEAPLPGSMLGEILVARLGRGGGIG